MNKALKSVIAAMLGVVVLVAIIGGGIALGKKYGFDVTEVFSGEVANAETNKTPGSSNSSSSQKPDHEEPSEDYEIMETLTLEVDHLTF